MVPRINARISPANDVKSRPHAERDLKVVEDEFSVKVQRADDPRFWVRIERDAGDGFVVTDYNAGSRPESEVGAGVMLAIETLARGAIGKVVFRDLLPSGTDGPDLPARMVQAADRVKRICRHLEAETGQEMASFKMEPRRGKIDAIVTFR